MATTVLSFSALTQITKKVLHLDEVVIDYDSMNDRNLILLKGNGKSFKSEIRKVGSLSHFLVEILPPITWGFYAQTMDEALGWQI